MQNAAVTSRNARGAFTARYRSALLHQATDTGKQRDPFTKARALLSSLAPVSVLLFFRSCFCLLAALSAFFFLTTAGIAATAKPKIIVGGDHDNPPYEYLENEQPTGFNVELIRAAAEVLGLDIEIRLGPWNKVRRDLELGRLDALAGMYYSPERRKAVNFTVAHTMVSPAVFVRQDSPVRSFQDIQGKEIIVQEGDVIHDLLKQGNFASRIITVTDPAEALELLAAGNHDCAFMPSRLQGEYFIKKLKLAGLRTVTTDLPPFRYCFAVRKDFPELRYKLDEGLNTLRETGKYRAIYEKWFGVYEKRDWWQTIRYFVFGLAAIAALLLASLAWSWSLKRQVNRKTAEINQAKDAISKRLIALTSPPETTGISFSELFNLEDIQKIQDAFAEVAGVASIITKPDGTPITQPSRFCRLCNDIIRKTDKGLANCFYSDSVIGRYNPEGPVIRQCLSGGLWDAGASITVGGKHIANWLIGQVKNEAIDEEQLIKYAREIGADENEFRKALQEVPVGSLKRFQKIAEALFLFANELSLKAYQNVQQARLITEREQMANELRKAHTDLEQRVIERTSELFQSRQMLQLVLDHIPQRVFWKDLNSVYVGCNKLLALDSGYNDPEKLLGKNDFDMTWADTAERYRADDKQVMSTGLPKINYEEPQTKSDGSTAWLRTTKVPLHDKDGNTIGVLGMYEDVTDRKKAEDALRESEEKYHAIVDAFDGQIYICSHDYRIEFMNKALIERTGRDATGELCYQVLHERDSICPWCVNDQVQKGETVRWEVQSPKDNRWYYVVNTPIHRADGSISKQAMILDITDRKKAENALRESEEKYRKFIETIDLGVFVTTPGYPGRMLEANRAMVAMCGFNSIEELLAAPVVQGYQDPEDRKRLLEELKEKGFVKNHVLYMKRRDGTPAWASVTLSVQRDNAGNVKWINGILDDITQRKLAEEALRESEEKYRTFVNNINLGVFMSTIDHPGRFLQVNQAMVDICGFGTKEEMLKTSVAQWYHDPSDRTGILHALKEKGFVKGREVRLRKQDGAVVWGAMTLSLQSDEHGTMWTSGVLEDITDRKRAEELLALKTAELERSNKELEHFASIASHDLKAPLSTISGFAQLLHERYEDKLDEKARRALTHIIKGTQTMDALINDLLAYARVTSSGKAFKPVRCATALNTALANLQADIEKQSAIITFDELPVVLGDEMQFVQVFQNLIGNAIRYRGEQPPRVHVSARRIDDSALHSAIPASGGTGRDSIPQSTFKPGWLFSVKDNGIGIDAVHFANVFKIFKRIHQDQHTGTGLGLAVCKKIVERHGGDIWVESEPGKGSTFFFTVPDSAA